MRTADVFHAPAVPYKYSRMLCCWILFPAEAAEPQRIKPQKLFVLLRVFRGFTDAMLLDFISRRGRRAAEN